MQHLREQRVNREKAETGQGGSEDTAQIVAGSGEGGRAAAWGKRGKDALLPFPKGRPAVGLEPRLVMPGVRPASFGSMRTQRATGLRSVPGGVSCFLYKPCRHPRCPSVWGWGQGPP